MVALNTRKAFGLASARAAVRFPHGTNSADALAEILRGAIADLQGETPTTESVLADFIAWRDRAQDGDEGCNYLNGDGGDRRDGWAELDEIAEAARAVLAKQGALQ